MQLFPLDETAPPCMLMGMMEEHKAAGWKVREAQLNRAFARCSLVRHPLACVCAYTPALPLSPAPAVRSQTPIWEVYKSLVTEGNGKPAEFIEIERFAFYERAKKAYCVVATG